MSLTLSYEALCQAEDLMPEVGEAELLEMARVSAPYTQNRPKLNRRYKGYGFLIVDGTIETIALINTTPTCEVCNDERQIPFYEDCPKCTDPESGEGYIERPTCQHCGGSGEVKVYRQCPACSHKESQRSGSGKKHMARRPKRGSH